jgi:L-fuculose-phosphate aldolase
MVREAPGCRRSYRALRRAADPASYDVPVDPLSSATDSVIEAGRRLGARRLISAGEGNLSVRLDADRLLVSPAGLRKDELAPEDLVVVWLDHPEREARSRSGRGPTSDLAIHLAVHAARPDIRAVVHAHLPAAMALTLAGVVPDPAALPETALLLPRLPFVSIGVPGSSELAARVAAALSDPPEPLASSVLLERHGAVAVGRDPAHAVDRLELVEVLCRTWRDALLLRAASASVVIVDGPGPGPPVEGR